MNLNKITLSWIVWISIALGSGTVLAQDRQQSDTRYPLIPYPTSLTPAGGKFIITPSTLIVLSGPPVFEKEAATLNQFFINSFGRPLRIRRITAPSLPKDQGPFIELKYDNSIREEEGYHLIITGQQVLLSARTPAGIFMAIQTIRQLLPALIEQPDLHPVGKLTLPALTIRDAPAYAWRGMHLDVSRHFFSIAYLKKFIDVMALYKFNKFHLHLTDDQGWRIEIKKYPKLTEYGAWRSFNNQDSACMRRSVDNPDFIIDPAHIIQKDGKTLYGGFYTQAEMKDLVAYAAGKHIDIIPEIDMPGHMMAAINQYPFLSCDGSSVFGELFSTPICPCLPSTFQFAKDVYTEIMHIFPSRYLHIGGDEVDRSLWAKSDECKALMKKEGLKTPAELQSYFINNMEKFFNSKGRKLIGWDEVLEGGISKTAIIMYWRSWVPKAPSEAAKNGNKVIMTPGNPLYFDAIPDKNSLPNVYHFNPIPKGLTDAEAANIIGAQANIWTEMIPTEARADYMYMPRMTALAEVLWTHRQDYDSYLRRLRSGYDRLDTLKVHYRLPDLSGFLSLNVFTGKDTLWIPKPLQDLTIRYTTDSTAPTEHSSVLNAPLIIRHPQWVRVAAFRPDGSRGDIYTLQYQRQDLAEPATVTNLSDGLTCSQYKGSFKSTANIPHTKPDTIVTVTSIEVPKAVTAPAFGLQYRGYLNIPQDGIYSFYLTCDDGGILKIADREVVNNDGNHPPIEKNGQVALKKGYQKIALDFIEGGGGYTLQLKYSFSGSKPREIPAQWLKN
jgi:hexosaminidase